MPATGTYQMIDERPVVRFERTFPHPVEAAWQAVTEPSELAQWFPTRVEFEALRPGARINFRFEADRYPPMTGEVLEVDPPRRFAFTWGDDELTFELEPRDGGDACRLVFTVVLDSAEKAARDAAGWDVCLGKLETVIQGDPTTPPRTSATPDWQAYYEEYQQRGLPATAPIPE